MKITNKIVKEIRTRMGAGESYRKIAMSVGVSSTTVWRYSTDATIDKSKQRGMERWDRTKKDPVIMERKRHVAREWARAERVRQQEKRKCTSI